jgi:two-component system LytT family response regulator
MPKINGFEMLELVEQPPAVIFTTAFDEYAIKAFEAHATDYLLKPFSKDRFNKAIEKFLALRTEKHAPKKPKNCWKPHHNRRRSMSVSW